MSAFSILLESPERRRRIDGVRSFVGEDKTGSFGILPGHARLLASLEFGLARYRADGDWSYLALPGGLLYFEHDRLHLCTRRFLLGADYETISQALETELRAEEAKRKELRDDLRRLEEAMLRRLWQAGRGGAR